MKLPDFRESRERINKTATSFAQIIRGLKNGVIFTIESLKPRTTYDPDWAKKFKYPLTEDPKFFGYLKRLNDSDRERVFDDAVEIAWKTPPRNK